MDGEGRRGGCKQAGGRGGERRCGLRGVGQEHFGLRDADARYRHRHLDLLANADSRDAFVRRAAVPPKPP